MIFRFLVILFVCGIVRAQGQTGVSETNLPRKKPNVIIESIYDHVFKGRLSRIVNDSLYFTAQPYNTDSTLNHFYLDANYKEHIITVTFLKSVTIRGGRVLGFNTLVGAVAGAIIFGTLAYHASDSDGNDFLKTLGKTAVASGAGILVGGPIGFFTGIFSRKKFFINRSIKQLDKLRQYIY